MYSVQCFSAINITAVNHSNGGKTRRSGSWGVIASNDWVPLFIEILRKLFLDLELDGMSSDKVWHVAEYTRV